MAPIKFEDNIKDKLEQRTIAPAHDAWSKLSQRLDEAPKKQSFGFWWLGIAASLIGIAVITAVLYNNTSESQGDPILVQDELKQPNTIKSNATELVLQPIEKELLELDKNQETPSSISLNKQVSQSKIVLSSSSSDIEKSREQKDMASEVNPVVVNHKPKTTTAKKNATFEDLKIKEVVAQIQKLQEERSDVSEADIDALLTQAQKDITAQRIRRASQVIITHGNVDADALLLEVESDLENSFRDRVFEALKSSYKKVKTAVAERNN